MQFLENELAVVTQGNFSIHEYLLKVKNLCSEISKLDAEEPVSDAHYGVILFVDYKKNLCLLFPQYRVGKSAYGN